MKNQSKISVNETKKSEVMCYFFNFADFFNGI